MTTSTDAILFYGYCWDEETDQPWTIGREEGEGDEDEDGRGEEGDDDWQDRYARTRGLVAPTATYPSRANTQDPRRSRRLTSAEQAIVLEYEAYESRKSELVEASGCEILVHCSGEYPMPCVAVGASVAVSHRGDMTKIESLAIDPAWKGQLASFCEAMGIRTDGLRAAWYLVSYWSR